MKERNKKINEALQVLRSGGTVVFPTETSYGLAADATNEQAVVRLMKIKGRGSKTLPIIAADLAMAKKCVQLDGLALQLACRFWPGALTMVLNKRTEEQKNIRTLSKYCVQGGQIAVRVSSNQIACELSHRLGKPIVATSANRSDQPDCYSIRAVKSQYKSQKLQPDYILNAGALPKRKPSTLVKVQDDKIKVLRKGKICLPKNLLDSIG
jgi:L-threonylcarbamoyladenylate synthase